MELSSRKGFKWNDQGKRGFNPLQNKQDIQEELAHAKEFISAVIALIDKQSKL